jgi:hypothetical protein
VLERSIRPSSAFLPILYFTICYTLCGFFIPCAEAPLVFACHFHIAICILYQSPAKARKVLYHTPYPILVWPTFLVLHSLRGNQIMCCCRIWHAYHSSHHGTPTLMLHCTNISISESGINSSHTHNLAKPQSYQGLESLLSDIKFMTMVNSMIIYRRFQEINACLKLVHTTCLLVNSAKCQYFTEYCQEPGLSCQLLILSCPMLILEVNSLKCWDEQCFLVLDLISFDGTNS